MSPLQTIAQTVSGHIRQPFTLAEIVAKIDAGEYSAELMQHLLLWSAKAEDVIEDAHGSLVLAHKSAALNNLANYDDIGTAINAIEDFLSPEPLTRTPE